MLQRVISLFLLIAVLAAANSSPAQVIDLYGRISDPRGIARLDSPDTGKTFAVTFHGDATWNIDSADHIPDVATDTGSGVITHIWSALGSWDTSVTLWLYINDTLVVKDYYNEFFQKLRGFIRPPLDTSIGGAQIWDVHIPYHHGFRLAMRASNGNVYFAFEWHRVPDSILPYIPLHPLSATIAQQAAESRYLSAGSPWHDSDVIVSERHDTLLPGSTVELAKLFGPAMLETMRFLPSSYDFASLDSLWLNLYWDNSPIPSVHVPLKDFFLCPVNVTNVRALQLRANRDSGFISYFPMPFAHRARIELVRTGSTPIGITTILRYHRESIDQNAYGYFHADFSESNPTRYHVWHPVIHTVGRGRYVGFGWGVMGHPFPVFLEGNPRFQIDSDATHFIEYTGGEDYLDGAWWFVSGPFSQPFAGYTDVEDQFYRFHYMDCYEFRHSFDFDFQPGNAADIYDHFRTVGYYYKHWTPFWTNRDTLIPGENWQIAGYGYPAHTMLPILLGPVSLRVTTDDSGAFNTSLTVPSSWQPGVYYLSVNGEPAPEKYYVLASPAIRPLIDTLPITLRAGDSLWVKGIGFQPGEIVNFYLDSIPLHQSAVANLNNEFVVMLRMPYIAEHAYVLVARGTRSGNATAIDRVTITRTDGYEFEDMMPPDSVTPGDCHAENVSYYWHATWSKQMYVTFQPDTLLAGARLELSFTTMRPDTFDVMYHASIGPNLGRYSIRLDGDSLAAIDGYANTGQWMPAPLPTSPIQLGIHFLPAGRHHILFTCLGKSDSATAYGIEPDCLVLRPTTYMALTPGTILASVLSPDTPQGEQQRFSLRIYPNPIRNEHTEIALTLPASETPFFDAHVVARAFDVLGRNVPMQMSGYMTNGTLIGELSFPKEPAGTYFVQLRLVAPSGTILDLPPQSVLLQ